MCWGSIRDQSVTMRDPQQLSEHLEGLVKDVEQTEETVREVENIFENVPDFSDDEAASRRCPPTAGNSGGTTCPRNRMRN